MILVVLASASASACSDDEALPPLVDAPVADAAVTDAAIDGAVQIDAAACAGTVVGGACWYKGAVNQSCTTVCTAHGGVSAATITFAGAASANDRSHQAGCQAVAAALSTFAFNAGVDNVNETNDYGCVEEPDKTRTELVSQNATLQTSAHVMLARFCACLQ